VTGQVSASDFPTTAGVVQPTFGGGGIDAFVAKIGGPAPITTLAIPRRLTDTRTVGGPIASGTSRCFTATGQVGILADATSVVLNVTAVGHTTDGWLTVYPNGQSVPTSSTLNFSSSAFAVANGAIVRLGTGGQVCVAVGTLNAVPGSAQVVLDVTGFFPTSALSALAMLPNPVRLTDTRAAGGPIASGSSRCWTVAGMAGIPADASAVVLNVTAVGSTANGWLTVFANGQAVPATSTVNFDRSQYAFANGTLTRIGGGGQVCASVGTVNAAPSVTQVILGATGYLSAGSLTQLPTLAPPQRLVDTRTSGGPISTGTSRCFQVTGVAGIPANATSVVLNATAVGFGTTGWLTAYPSGQAVPATSTVNFDASEFAVANGAIVALGADGQVCVSVGTVNMAPGSAQVILDVLGYFAA
jgi:hypothetical protein